MSERPIAEAFPPGEFIKEELEARGWSQVELAEIVGRYPTVVNEWVSGKRSITPETAKALGTAFGTSAMYWMNLESTYKLWKTRGVDEAIGRRAKLYGMAPVKEMVKRGWLEASENVEVLEQQILHFFGINTLDEEPEFISHAARKATPYSRLTPSQRAWLFRARQLARAAHARPFSDDSFDRGLSALKLHLHSARDIRHVPKVLAEAGIRFLIVEHLPQTRIDGVTFWLDAKSPVIVLSMRYDRIDWFWFSLCHELGHVKNRDGLREPIPLDTDLVGDHAQAYDEKPESEKRADAFATEFLIKKAELDNFVARVRPLFSRAKIQGFAKRIGVHPGIVVGQLHHRKVVDWSYYRNMLEKVRHIITQSALTDGWGHLASTRL